MTPDLAELRLHCIAAAPERAEAIEAIARVLAPSAQVSHATTPSFPGARPLPDVTIVDADGGTSDAERRGGDDVTAEVETVRRLRAGGFNGGIIVLGDAILSADSTTEEEFSRLGATRVPTARLGAALTAAFVAALEPRSADPGAAPLLAHLARTRQLLSAGEIAMGLQHSMNNPLAAILAESQLLEMDELAPEQREAVARIVALCRRMTAVVRRLDGIGGPVGGAAPQQSDG
jgi:signal transduction histidine kinase